MLFLQVWDEVYFAFEMISEIFDQLVSSAWRLCWNCDARLKAKKLKSVPRFLLLTCLSLN